MSWALRICFSRCKLDRGSQYRFIIDHCQSIGACQLAAVACQCAEAPWLDRATISCFGGRINCQDYQLEFCGIKLCLWKILIPKKRIDRYSRAEHGLGHCTTWGFRPSLWKGIWCVDGCLFICIFIIYQIILYCIQESHGRKELLRTFATGQVLVFSSVLLLAARFCSAGWNNLRW